MLSGVCVGTNDLERAGEFYDALLASIDMRRLITVDNEIGYGALDGPVTFWVLTPYNGEKATFGNGTQVMFLAPNKAKVDAFHETAIASGGTDEGAPGPRDYSPGYYGAYVRDLDGNKLHVSIAVG
ncbi:MAG: VOC family protein [Pseudomonadota bacterium]